MALCLIAHGGDRLESAVRAYWALGFVPGRYDKLLIAQVDLRGNGSPDVLFSLSYTTFQKHAGNLWTVLEQKKDGWVQPKTVDVSGRALNVSQMIFSRETASCIFLPKYGKRGLLALLGRGGWFSYLEGDTIRTIPFESAADLGMSEPALKKLAGNHKIVVEERAGEIAPSPKP